ncbi:hypothetical protein JCM11251_006611 [Rhodosporidiobolus azoricus]
MPSKAPKQTKESSDPARTYNQGDIVLAKIKGYPAWPAQVIEHTKAPPKVVREKPKTKNINLVQFFPAGDFAWQTSKDLSPLTPKEIDAYVSGGKKKGELLEAYQIAQDPQAWNQRKADEQAEYEELLAQAGAEEDEDQLASDGGEGGKGGKKRKRASEAGKKDDKKKKGETKGKKAGKKGDDEAPASKKAKTANGEDPGSETVKSWRHKLQKVFLGKGDPAADEMPKCAEYFDAMENFEMKEEWLKESKLNKVLKRIALMKDSAIPDDEKYSFRERSAALAQKWASLAGGADSTPQPAAAEKEDAPVAENGAAAEEDKKDDAAAEKTEEPAPEAAEEKEEDKVEDEAKEEKMEVDAAAEAPTENGTKEEEAPAPAAAVEDKKEDAPAAEASS